MAIRRTGSQTLVNRGVTAAAATPVNIITGSGGGGATVNISSIQIANSTFVAKDDLAIDTAGGYMIINGTGFQSGAAVYIQGTAATSTAFVSSSRLNVTVPALSSGLLDVYVVNTDGSGSIYLQSLRANGVPSWTTTSPLTSQDTGNAFAINLVATGAAGDGTITYAVSSGSSLPSGTTLASNGYFYGTISGIETETTYSFSVDAIDAQNQETARSFNITVRAGDGNFKDTVLLLNGETSINAWIIDASTNGFALTVNGDTRPVAFSPYNNDFSVKFDGSNDYISVPAGSDFSFGTGDFTIECFVNTTDNSLAPGGYSRSIMRIGDFDFYLRINQYHGGTDGALRVDGLSDGSTVVIKDGVWHHIAIVRQSNTIRLWIDGIYQTSGSGSTYSTNHTNADLNVIGGRSNPIGGYFNGYISNVRVVKGTAVYTGTSNFTVPTAPLTAVANTVLLTCARNRFIDANTTPKTITVNDAPEISGWAPLNETDLITGSGYFDGTGDFLELTDSSNLLDIGGAVASIECWYYPTAQPAYGILISKGGGAASWSTSNGFEYQLSYTSGTFTVYYNTAGSAGSIQNTTTSPLNRWYHLVVATDASNNLSLFVNGTRVATTTNAITKPTTRTSVRIGNDVSASHPSGYITDMRVIVGTGAYSASASTITVPTSSLTPITNTRLLTLQSRIGENNNRFVDSSGINNIITRNGNTTQGTFSPFSQTGWSNYFDGTGDYLTVSSSSSVSGTGVFTVEFWIYSPVFSSGYKVLNAAGTGGFSMTLNSTGTIGYGRALVATDGTTTGTINFNQWNHIAAVRSGTGSGQFVIYINGVSAGSFTNATNYNSGTVYIGVDSNGTSFPFTGNISNFRIVNGSAVYTTGFTPSINPLTAIANTSLLTCQSNRFVDSSPNNFTLTRNGDVTVQNFSPFSSLITTPNSYGVVFDGNSDYLSISSPSANIREWWNTDFTVECWIYPTTLSGTSYNQGGNETPSLIGNVSINNDGNYWSFGPINNGTVRLYYYNGGSVFPATSTETVKVNQWNHIALTNVAGTGFKYWVNGVGSSNITISGTPQSGSDLPFVIGWKYYASGSAGFTGTVSNLRVTKGTALYSSNFNTSTTPFTAIANTSLLTCQSSTIKDNSNNNFTLTRSGDTKITPVGFFGNTIQNNVKWSANTVGGSFYIDGTGDYLNWTNSNFSFGTGDFTVEAWVYISGAADFGIFGVGGASTGSYGLYWVNSTSKFESARYGDTAGSGRTTNTYAARQWIHVAAVRSSGTAKLYINGVVDSGSTYSMGSITNSGPYSGAIWGSATGIGYISGLKVSKYAVYTNNFAVPTAPISSASALVLLEGTNGSIIDYTGKNNLETVGDAKIRNNIRKFGNTSIFFDGTGDTLTVPDNPSLQLGSSNFTIEFWAYPLVLSGNQWIAGKGDTSTVSGSMFSFPIAGVGSNWDFYYGSSGLGLSRPSLVIDTWQHVAVVRNGATITIYLNGTSVSTGNLPSSSTVLNTGGSTALTIGGYTGSPFNGYIDDFRVTKGVARYTSNFSVPSSQFLTS